MYLFTLEACKKNKRMSTENYQFGGEFSLYVFFPCLQASHPTWCPCISENSLPKTWEEPLASYLSSSSLSASSVHKCLASETYWATAQVNSPLICWSTSLTAGCWRLRRDFNVSVYWSNMLLSLSGSVLEVLRQRLSWKYLLNTLNGLGVNKLLYSEMHFILFSLVMRLGLLYPNYVRPMFELLKCYVLATCCC